MTTKKNTNAGTKVDESRRDFLGSVTMTFGAVGAVAAAYPFVKTMSPSKEVESQKFTKVDLSAIAEGSTKKVIWRGKAVFIKHRTPSEIASAKAGDETATIEPQTDADRVQRPQWLVTIAHCTHLGCIPLDGGPFGGWACPCHGSQFDGSGRVRRGPAARNLDIPPYAFLDDNTIKIG
jgi:ubiquinol-cytochrome c reductase iron-sulfur subunit